MAFSTSATSFELVEDQRLSEEEIKLAEIELEGGSGTPRMDSLPEAMSELEAYLHAPGPGGEPAEAPLGRRRTSRTEVEDLSFEAMPGIGFVKGPWTFLARPRWLPW